MSLVGPSGSGKSSLLRAVIGLQKPLAGTVETGLAPSEIGILFQDDALLPWKTARENVALGLTFNGSEPGAAREQADVWLRRLGLAGFEHRFLCLQSEPVQCPPGCGVVLVQEDAALGTHALETTWAGCGYADSYPLSNRRLPTSYPQLGKTCEDCRPDRRKAGGARPLNGGIIGL